MSRLIDADALMKAMYHRAFETDGDTMWQSGCWVRYRAIEQVIKEQPTIEPERKKGKWLHKSKQLAALNTAWWYECSICGYHAFNGMRTDFCPNCGAEISE